MRTKLLPLLLAATLGLLCCSCHHQSRTPFFVQITDPQLGFITESADFQPEMENMGRIAEAVNRLRPDFVVFTGDLVQWRTDEAALEGFEQIRRMFDPNIKLHFVPGNHDVGDKVGELDVVSFVERYGEDRFIYNAPTYTAIGYNSSILKALAPEEAELYEWLSGGLEAASQRGLPIIVMAHHPIYVESPDEEDAGVNLPKSIREKYLNLLSHYGVSLSLSGHLHHCASATYGQLRLVTSGAAGRPLGDEGSGITIVTIDKQGPSATFYEIDKIPASID